MLIIVLVAYTCMFLCIALIQKHMLSFTGSPLSVQTRRSDLGSQLKAALLEIHAILPLLPMLIRPLNVFACFTEPTISIDDLTGGSITRLHVLCEVVSSQAQLELVAVVFTSLCGELVVTERVVLDDFGFLGVAHPSRVFGCSCSCGGGGSICFVVLLSMVIGKDSAFVGLSLWYRFIGVLHVGTAVLKRIIVILRG